MHFTTKTLILAVFLSAQIFAARAQNEAQNSTMTATEQSASAELLQATNEDRSTQRLQSVREDPMLTKAAWEHAQRMVQSGTLSHQLPGEQDLIVRIQQTGLHCTTVAENVAQAPTSGQINAEWMQSPTHRANLLDPRVNVVGIAIVRQHGELYAVEDFARALAVLTPSQQMKQVASMLASHGQQVRSNDALATSYCHASPTGTRSLPKLVMRYSTADLSQFPRQVEQGISAGTYHSAIVGACGTANQNGFAAYQIVILLY